MASRTDIVLNEALAVVIQRHGVVQRTTKERLVSSEKL